MTGTRTTWLTVWWRAVIAPSARRAAPAWLGCALIAGLLFGGNGMRVRDLTGFALRTPAVGLALALTWILIFVPTARLLVRAEAAAYLRALPAPRHAPRLIVSAVLVGLQLPWLALWVAGEGVRGLAVVAVVTLAIVALARLRFVRAPRGRRDVDQRSALGALVAVYTRALARRAGDALVRGVGLALLAGLAGGLFIRNNALAGAGAASLGASVIAICLVPAHVGPLLVLLEAHRATSWLAASLGIPPASRMLALVVVLASLHLAATAIAVAAAAVLGGTGVSTVTALALAAFAVATGSALGCARLLLGTDAASRVAQRAVVGVLATAALAIGCLAVFGLIGLVGFLAITAFALLGVVPE